MTKILLAIYIALVLLLSGLAKAGTLQHTLVRRAQINKGILTIGGNLATPCQSDPALYVDNIGADEIKLSVLAETEPCNDILGPPYILQFDLNDLALGNGGEYFVKIAELPGVVLPYTAVSGELSTYKNSRKTFGGVLSFSPETQSYLLSSGDTTVSVLNRGIDLKPFLNHRVAISGYVVQGGFSSDPVTGATSPHSSSLFPVLLSAVAP